MPAEGVLKIALGDFPGIRLDSYRATLFPSKIYFDRTKKNTMHVLIVDDNQAVCDALSLLLTINDIDSLSCNSPQEALNIVSKHNIGLVIQDMNFTADTTSGEEGKALFYQLRQQQSDLPIILLTAWTHLEMAVELVREGAADYLSKPWDDNKLLTTIKNLLELRELSEENKRYKAQHEATRNHLAQYDLCGLIYRSPNMERLLEMSVQVAQSDIPVLITGPNGAGKEKIAEIIQANSSRQNKPFIKLNAGALPADLMEAELFGAETGAYTGANKTRIGCFEAADGGTLFLDEIGNLPLAGQIKLLRTLQTGEFQRLGSSKTHKVDVRIISATNADLQEDIDKGLFRQDLYYRLNVIELALPPLCQRHEDIVPLIHHFAPGKNIALDAQQSLLQHSWPGNIRELENAVKRALILTKSDTLTLEDFGFAPAKPSIPAAQHDIEKSDVEQALFDANGVVAHAAKSLGLSRQALYRRMQKHGIKSS